MKVPPMTTTACPFCGVVTDVPHDTQEGCIEALHAEIARMRRILTQVTPPQPRAPRDTADDRDDRGN
jgi:hypothetical protein